MKYLKNVLEVLQSHTLYAKRSKCSFRVQEIEYLVHIISKEGVKTDPTKVATIL